MPQYIGDFAEDATIYHYFNTFSSANPSASITMTTLADTDLYVYKDGNIADIVTDGATVVIDFDGRTGIHKLTIDTSVDAAYAIGSDYMVIIEGATVDAGNITAAIFTFSIENRFDAAFERLGAPAGASVSADIAAIEAQTDDIGVAGIGLTAIPWNADWDTEVQSECNDAIEANHLDHLLAVDYDPASKPGVATALLNELVENNGGVSRYTAASLATAPGGTSTSTLLNSTVITGLVSNTVFNLTAGATDNDSYKGQMAVITDQATSTQKAVGLIASYTGAAKTVTLDVDPGIFTYLDGDTVDIFAVSGSSIPLEIDANGRVDLGSVGGTAQTSGDLAALSVQIDTVVDGIQTDLSNGTDGLGALSTDIATVNGLVTTVQADLDNGTDGLGAIKGDTAATQALAAGATGFTAIDTVVDGIQTDLDGVDGLTAIKGDTANILVDTGTTLDTAIAALQTDLDTLTDARGEPGQGTPGVSETMLTKVDYLYKAWRNRVTQDATTYSLFNDDGTTVGQKSTVSDNGTIADKEEVISGV